MGKINKLPKSIWELIAAGEVVERPASVVKELLENSIDAGADSITVEIQSGGIRYIRITDNGCGIAREDVPLAFVSHATSKISSASDLDAIGTLGFRGEALSSVAAVSRIEMLTKTADESIGTRIEIQGGEQTSLDDAGCPDGTTIIIRDLFYNTPARMKFLKSDKSEANAVSGVVDKIAISHPEISLRFIKDGKQIICTNGNGKLIDAVYSVYGREFADSLLECEYSINSLSVRGYISKPYIPRGSGSMQIFFVNNRFIKSKTACAALNEAYKNSIMVGKYPACVMFLEIKPELVDVNVHPAKTEVRFSDERAIFDLIYYAAKNTLSEDVSRPQATLAKAKPPVDILAKPQPEAEQESFYSYRAARNTADTPDGLSDKPLISNIYLNDSSADTVYGTDEDLPDLSVKTSAADEAPVEPSYQAQDDKTAADAQNKEVSFKYLGEAFKTYIFAEYNGKLVIIDKHASHERMIYNRLKSEKGSEPSQMLLRPVSVLLSREEYSAVTENPGLLAEAGFEIEDFGEGTVIVRACPLRLEDEDITSLIGEIAAYLTANKRAIEPEKLDWLYHNMACRAAVKAGNIQTDYELIEFTKQLLSDESIRFCPHGRPVLIELSKYELDKQFGRIQ